MKAALGLGVAMAAPLVWVSKRVAPARYVEAVRSRVYPGPVARLDDTAMAKSGKWGG